MIIAAGVASGVIGILAVVSRERHLTSLGNAFRDQRALAGRPCVFRPLAHDDRRGDHFRKASAIIQALLDCGFVVLGDIAIEPEHSVAALVRILVDPSGTKFACIAMSHPNYFLTIKSYTDDGSTVTVRSDRGGVLTSPPTLHRAFVARGTNAPEFVRRHKPIAPESALMKVSTLNELLALMCRDHERKTVWRAAQPPDELLASDLREFFGDRYAKWVPKFARCLHHPPKATALSK